jgi:hypothetical protein
MRRICVATLGVCAIGVFAINPQAIAQERPASHFVQGVSVDHHTYRAICAQPRDLLHAELCQQWRMAEAAEWQAIYTGVGLAGILLTLVFTGWAAVAASRAAKAAVMDQRAWLTTNLLLEGDLEFARDNSASVAIAIEITNVGKTPALSAYTNVDMFDLGPDQRERFKSFCDECRIDSEYGRVVLPGESYVRRWAASCSLGEGRFWPVIVGCVTYRTSTDDQLHQTSFIHALSRYDEPIDALEGNVPRDKLFIDFLAGSSAD